MKCTKTTLMLGLLLFIVAACNSQNGNLRFRTIAKSNSPDSLGLTSYREKDPALLIIANDDEIDALVPKVLAQDPDLVDQLHQLDYDLSFAILVLQGLKGQGGYSATVQRIVRQDDQVNVYAEFINPELGTRRIQAFTSPFHLVAVSKLGKWGQQIKFVLVVDYQPIVEINHLIP